MDRIGGLASEAYLNSRDLIIILLVYELVVSTGLTLSFSQKKKWYESASKRILRGLPRGASINVSGAGIRRYGDDDPVVWSCCDALFWR